MKMNLKSFKKYLIDVHNVKKISSFHNYQLFYLYAITKHYKKIPNLRILTLVTCLGPYYLNPDFQNFNISYLQQ